MSGSLSGRRQQRQRKVTATAKKTTVAAGSWHAAHLESRMQQAAGMLCAPPTCFCPTAPSMHMAAALTGAASLPTPAHTSSHTKHTHAVPDARRTKLTFTPQTLDIHTSLHIIRPTCCSATMPDGRHGSSSAASASLTNADGSCGPGGSSVPCFARCSIRWSSTFVSVRWGGEGDDKGGTMSGRCMDVWMDRLTERRTDGCMYGQMGGWMHG
eukprot:365749-Chlamydomonas_euryale.AAC.6